MYICCIHSLFWSITRILFFFFYFILFVSHFMVSTLQLSNCTHPHFNKDSDQEAMIRFMFAITYDPTQSLSTTWKPNVSFCEWTSIICNRRIQRVVSLNVSSMGLQGIVSPLLDNLSFLKILDLTYNKLHGHIPYKLGNVFWLKILYLCTNHLQDSILPTLGGFRSLIILSVFTNNLIGKIPENLCVLPNLQSIDLGEKKLMGTISACLGHISSLGFIQLDSKNLRGVFLLNLEC